jgi:hypothetical protein
MTKWLTHSLVPFVMEVQLLYNLSGVLPCVLPCVSNAAMNALFSFACWPKNKKNKMDLHHSKHTHHFTLTNAAREFLIRAAHRLSAAKKLKNR